LLTAYPPDRLSAQDVGLTIFSDGRVIVRRTINTPVQRGSSTVRVQLGMHSVDPGSFVALDQGAEIRGVRHSAALGQDGSLRRMVGRELTFRRSDGQNTWLSTGTLLSVDPLAVRIDGQVIFQLPGTPVFPDSAVRLEPDAELTIESARALPGLRLLYASEGLSWEATYALMLPRGGSGQATMTGNATLNNGARLSLRGAEVQLVAGDVRRARYAAQDQMRGAEMAQSGVVRLSSVAVEEAMGGTHLYSLPGRIDFLPGETQGIALFPMATVTTEREFVLEAQGYGVQQQWPDDMRDLHPQVAYRVRRPAGGNAGAFAATPLPGGVVRVYEPDSDNRPQLAGEAPINHTPGGRDLRLVTGTAFDITATKTQTTYNRTSDRSVEVGYRVVVNNAKTEPVVVLVTDQCPGRCDVLTSTVPAERESISEIGFKVTVPANGSATLEYRLRARW
jgi:hypothetical protein